MNMRRETGSLRRQTEPRRNNFWQMVSLTTLLLQTPWSKKGKSYFRGRKTDYVTIGLTDCTVCCSHDGGGVLHQSLGGFYLLRSTSSPLTQQLTSDSTTLKNCCWHLSHCWLDRSVHIKSLPSNHQCILWIIWIIMQHYELLCVLIIITLIIIIIV